MPEYEDDLQDNNMTDVNGAPGAMDEDGGFDPANAEPEDHSPTIQALCVTFSGTTSVITANIHTATGINSKRIAVPGHVTANKLAEMLKGVASW